MTEPRRKVERHPATQRRFREAATRFLALRKQQQHAADMMWAGTLASSFSAEELILLADYLCPRDHELLAHAGVPREAPHE